MEIAKKVLVVGLGRSGISAARFFAKKGSSVTVTDMKKKEELKESLQALQGLPIKFVLGEHPPKIFEQNDLIVPSPGVPLTLPGFKLAAKKKIPILGELEIASRHINIPMIAVTGTNGKSTTVTLIHEILKRGGKRVLMGGNIGIPLMDLIEPAANSDILVVEISSFQLDTLQAFHPSVGILLNITEDHLDRYKKFSDYVKSKGRLIKNLTKDNLFIVNGADKNCVKIAQRTRAKKCFFNSRKKNPGGLFLDPQEPDLKILNQFSPFRSEKVRETYLCRNSHLFGLHNKENMMAAIAACRFLGISQESIQSTLDSFLGLPHRAEFVREVTGVAYYDDSKATNVSATLMSLTGLPDKKVLLIAGGKDKGSDYKQLKSIMKKKIKHCYLIGEAAGLMRRQLGNDIKITVAETLEKAIFLASHEASWGDSVLLSPACASYDQFKNFEHRGDTFKGLVMRL
ncbi:MAG: UDP-N-acetylmuramoyl-L-alanine--D-glutamate ligase [bacterium]|nr:UDP-N-acetylmuramoyl-L-alanine--D-glutamate ligase [bacterium]